MVRVLLDPPPWQTLQEEAWTVGGCSSQTITGRKITGTSFLSISTHSVEQNRGENGDLLPPGPKEQIHRASHPRGALSGEQSQELARLLRQPGCHSVSEWRSKAARWGTGTTPSGWRTSQYPQLPSLMSCQEEAKLVMAEDIQESHISTFTPGWGPREMQVKSKVKKALQTAAAASCWTRVRPTGSPRPLRPTVYCLSSVWHRMKSQKVCKDLLCNQHSTLRMFYSLTSLVCGILDIA